MYIYIFFISSLFYHMCSPDYGFSFYQLVTPDYSDGLVLSFAISPVGQMFAAILSQVSNYYL